MGGASIADDDVATPALSGRSPLSVLVIGTGWPLETFIDRLLSGLVNRGVTLTILSRTRPAQAWLDRTGARWVFGPDPLDVRAFVRLMRRADHHRSGPTVRALAGQLVAGSAADPFAAIDVVYVPWVGTLVDHPDLTAHGVPVVTSCRGTQVTIAPWDPSRPGHAAGLRRAFRDAARIHCVSNAIRGEAERHGLDPNKAAVITPAVDPQRFELRSDRPADATTRVIAVGALTWGKDYEHALMGVRAAVDQGAQIHLRIIGEGLDRQHLRFSIEDLELEDHVELLGRRAPEAVAADLQAADVFLHTSMAEGISNAVLEAMAVGLPIVTTDAGGMTEAVRDGIEGIVVPVRDATACAAALVRLHQDPDLRRGMGSAGRTRITEHFQLEDQVDAFHALLIDAAGDR